MDIAVRVNQISKRFRIGARAGYRTLRESVSDAFSAPWRRLRGSRKIATDHAAQEREIWALRNVSFEVPRGEVLGLIGRNGAGKSTLLKILSRITPPTSGYAEIRGRVGSLLEVGTGFHPELTGRENVYLSGAILGMKRAEIRRRFDAIVTFAEVDRFIDTAIKHYSSGMHMRLAFAVAAHLEPEVLLVDEVLAVGDAAFQRKCLGRMRSVAGSGRTILFVSHNMAAVTQLCERALWLDEGQVRLTGSAQDVVREYMTSSDAQRAERIWEDPEDSPGDERVRLRACRLLQGGAPTGVADINAPLTVEVEIDVRLPAQNLVTGVSLYEPGGQCLFNRCDWRPNALAPGRYRKSMEVPAQTLAEGRFSVLVQCVFFEPSIQSVVCRDVLAFDTVDSAHPDSVRGYYKGGWPGLMRLGLPWSDAQRIGDSGQRPGP